MHACSGAHGTPVVCTTSGTVSRVPRGLAQAYMTQKMPRQDITLSVLLVVGGCIIAGVGDFSFDLAGWAFLLPALPALCVCPYIFSDGEREDWRETGKERIGEKRGERVLERDGERGLERDGEREEESGGGCKLDLPRLMAFGESSFE